MKQQILVKLLSKYAGLPKKFLELLAEKLSKKVQDESGIDDAITALDNAPISVQDMAADFQRYGDSRVTDAQREWEIKNKKPNSDSDDDDDDDDDDEDNAKPKPKQEKRTRSKEPLWAKRLNEKVDKLFTERAQSTYKEKVKERLSDVPERFYRKWALPTNDDELENFVTDAEKEYLEFVQEQKNAGIAIVSAPGRVLEASNKNGSTRSDKSIQGDIDRYVERNKKEADTKKTTKTA